MLTPNNSASSLIRDVSARKERHAVQVYSQLLGEADLPWEGDRLTVEVQRKLGVFRRPVLQLLQRDPTARISLHQFARGCDSIFDSPSLPNPGAANEGSL